MGAVTLLIAGVLAVAGPVRAQIAIDDHVGAFALSVTSWRDLPFRTVLRQQYDYSCGSAALATLLRYHYGRAAGEAEIFKAMYAAGDQAKIRKVGFSLLDMKSYLAGLGLKSDGYRVDYSQLLATTSPSIAVISVGPYRHFVVVKGVRPDTVLIGDPALGLKIYTRRDFEKVWNHIIFAIHDPGPSAGAFNRPEEWESVGARPTYLALRQPAMVPAIDIPVIFQVPQLRRNP